MIVKRMSGRNYCPSVSHCTLRRQTATLKFMRRHVLFPVIRHSHTTRDNNNCFLCQQQQQQQQRRQLDWLLRQESSAKGSNRFILSSLCAWLLPGRSLGRSPGLCRAISLGLVAWLTDWLPGWLAGWLDSLAIITSSIIQRSAAKLCASRHSSSFFLTFSSFFCSSF